jgi:D-alanyl-D-alanine carboxypeptidase
VAVFGDPGRRWTPEEVLRGFVLDPRFPPGSGWNYSDTGYLLLGMVARRASGAEVSAELRTRFWIPLGLNSTFLESEETSTGTLAHGWYDLDRDGDLDDMALVPRAAIYSVAWTAGGMVSTAEDLVRWSDALFRGRVLKEDSLGQMLTFHSPTPGEPYIVAYGLGALVYPPALMGDERAIGHGGNIPGYLNAMVYLPAYEISLTVLMNDNNERCIETIPGDLVRSLVAGQGKAWIEPGKLGN